jgi:hypothetical protein
MVSWHSGSRPAEAQKDRSKKFSTRLLCRALGMRHGGEMRARRMSLMLRHPQASHDEAERGMIASSLAFG